MRASRPSGWAERLGVAAFLVGLTLFLVYADWLWRWDQLLYDTHVKSWFRPPPDDIVIVAIDDASLGELGRWPWSRQTHATLIQRLMQAGARAIILDIIFAEHEEQDRQSDQALVAAVAASGRVALPVLIEQVRQGGQLREILPFSPLASAAATLGHVHIDLDPDGIARGLFLLEGQSEAYWPNLGVAMLRLLEPGGWDDLPGTQGPEPTSHSPYVVARDHHVLLPFAGPPGHFPRISYAQVLSGMFLEDAFRDKIVLVGVTATGLGDALPTPVSGHSQPMPGVEINANLIDSLRRGMLVEVLDPRWRMLLAGVLVLLPALLFSHLTPRYVLLSMLLLLVLTLAVSTLLLREFHLWFAPVPALLGLSLSYPLWSWLRLEHTMRYLTQELERLHGEPAVGFLHESSLPTSAALRFLQRVVCCDGWLLRDNFGNVLSQWGVQPDEPVQRPRAECWQLYNQSLWAAIPRDASVWHLGLNWPTKELAGSADRRMLTDFVGQFTRKPQQGAGTTVELIEHRIQQVQAAISRLRTMRRFIANTVGQMGDGLLVVNPAGQVVLANQQAAVYLAGDVNADLVGSQLLPWLDEIEIHDALTWDRAFQRALIGKDSVRCEARKRGGPDLLVLISPMSLESERLHGLIISLSDIGPLKYSERKRAEALSFLSHDVRSPITSLLSLVQMTESQGERAYPEELPARVRHYATKALHLTNGFLQLARAEGMSDEAFAEIDLVTIAHNAADEVYPAAHAKKIRLLRQFELGDAWLRGDAELLERALINLLSNAIQYSPEHATVRLILATRPGWVRCCVEDPGVGISPSEQPNVFDRFYRADRGRRQNQGGLGLGLAFVKVVAEKHGGAVSVDSEPGKGSRFCFEIPVACGDG